MKKEIKSKYTDKERLEIELHKAKEVFEQQKFFVNWLEMQIELEEIKELKNKIVEEKE